MSPQDSLRGETLRQALSLVYELTGNTLEPDRTSLLEGRLKRRVRALGLPNIRSYIELVRSGELEEQERQNLIEAITTHKTSFFRTRGVWDRLHDEYIPELASGGTVRLWSAACSTGQESYSLAILGEKFASGPRPLRFDILASDVSPVCVQRTKEGVYTEEQVEDATRARPDWQPERYFERVDSEHLKASSKIRSSISFQEHNLFDALSGGSFHAVLVRNVIIYFNEEDKRHVLRRVAETLVPGGLLVLGESESLAQTDRNFTYLAPCMYRKTS